MRPSVISIDPPMSRDLDDAVSAMRAPGGGWVVDVCVPDVPSAVAPGTPEDEAARAAVATRYGGNFIRRSMLPSHIVEALSLSPHRTTRMCWFRITLTDGLEVSDVRINAIRHRTDARLSYLEADEILSTRGHPLHPRISAMWDLASALHARRRARTGAAFDPTAHLYTTEEGVLAQLSAKESHRTHLLVMELMILANGALARHAHAHGLPIIYRNHRPRDSSHGLRAEVVREMRALEGVGPEEASERLRLIASRIGSATFGTRSEGHWGLDEPTYAWFTSPLRRYVDIVNLRTLVHGVVDRNAEETARHVDIVTRELRQASAEHHAVTSRAKIAGHVRAGRRDELQDWDLHTVLRACAEGGIISDMVADEVRRRLDAGAVSGKDIEAIFTHGREVLDGQTVQDAVDWLLADAQRQVMLAHDMVMRQRITRIPATSGGGKDFAAALRDIAELLEFELPDGHGVELAGGAQEHVPHPNPKGALLEEASARRTKVAFETVSRVGPSHEPRFTVEATWTGEGDIRRSRGSATSIRAAERVAAWEMLKALGAGEIAAASAPMRIETPASQPAKTLLLEHSVKSGGKVDFRPTERKGPDHQPVFHAHTLYHLDGRTIEGTGVAASRREAERLAAADVLARV